MHNVTILKDIVENNSDSSMKKFAALSKDIVIKDGLLTK